MSETPSSTATTDNWSETAPFARSALVALFYSAAVGVVGSYLWTLAVGPIHDGVDRVVLGAGLGLVVRAMYLLERTHYYAKLGAQARDC